MENKLGISIVVPVYNEEKTLENVINSLKSEAVKMNADCEIVAIDDGSTDTSLKILEKFSETPGIKIINHGRNKGYGASLKSGIKNSAYNLVAIIDSDGTYPASLLPEMAAAMKNMDMVIGARNERSAGIQPERRHAKIFLNRLASYLAGKHIPDLNSGMRIFKKDMVLKHWDLFPDRFSFSSTLTMIGATRGYETGFMPIDYHKRMGKSSIKALNFFGFIKLVVKLSLFFRPIKIFAPLSLFIFVIAMGILSAFLFGITEKFFDTTFVVLVSLAIQTFFFGLLAEIVTYNK